MSAAPHVEPITKGLRVYTAGHALHTWVAPMLSRMAKEAGITGHQITGVTDIGGSTALRHWEVPDAQNKVKQAIITGQVGVLTLSPIWPDAEIEKFALLELQHNPDIRVTVQEFWLPNGTYEPICPLDIHKTVNHNAATMSELRIYYYSYFQAMDDYVREVNQHIGKECSRPIVTLPSSIAVRPWVWLAQMPRPPSIQVECCNSGG